MAEGARLESVFRLIPNEGSNPSLSAKYVTKSPRIARGLFVLAQTYSENLHALLEFCPLALNLVRYAL